MVESQAATAARARTAPSRVENAFAAANAPATVEPAVSIETVRAAEWAALGAAAFDPQGRSASVRATLDALAEAAKPHADEAAVPAAADATRGDSEPLGTGLALSGGGIRSATFALGVLQALGLRRKLAQFDFLSTVSGGGYIGSWLSAWIRRDDFAAVERALADPDTEAPQVSWLRRYSNYLAPRAGLLTLDSLTLLSTWMRNVALNLAVLVTLGALLLVLPRWIAGIAAIRSAAEFPWRYAGWGCTVAGSVVGIGALVPWGGRRFGKALTELFGAPLQLGVALLLLGTWMGLVDQFSPRYADANAVSAAYFAVLFFALIGMQLAAQGGHELASVLADGLFGAPVAFAISAAIAAAGFGALWLFGGRIGTSPLDFEQFAKALGGLIVLLGVPWLLLTKSRDRFAEAGVYVLALAGSGLAAYGYMQVVRAILDERRLALAPPPLEALPAVITLGPPSMLVGFGLCGWLFVGLVGRVFFERSREWWGRLNACLLVAGCVWFGVFALSFYAPALMEWLVAAAPGWATTLAGSTWLASAVAMLFSPRPNRGSDRRGRILHAGSELVALVFATGLVLLLAFGVQRALVAAADLTPSPVAATSEISRFDFKVQGGDIAAEATAQARVREAAGLTSYFEARLDDEAALAATCVVAGPLPPPRESSSYLPAALLCREVPAGMRVWVFLQIAVVVLLVVFALLAWRVDVNRFSLHNLYKNRLIRCYLGASHRQRKPARFTGFDEQDDLPLARLAESRAQRPFHIINTAMNLSQGTNLAWQERKAAAFAFSPLYCGYTFSRDLGDPFRPGQRQAPPSHYRATADYASRDPGREEPGFSLGMALSASGAAVSPAMGRDTQPVRAFLLTLFNIRLGRWSPNPKLAAWREASPQFGVACLLQELFGYANDERKFVYLSDGGHFDNTALYELVRRRVATIVCVDAGADPERAFGDLGNAIHKCRVDFGVEIDIDLKPLRAGRPGGLPAEAFAIGRIVYPGTAVEGALVVIKPTLTHDQAEPVDVQAYARRNPDFPQQTTADQFFSESQFESYRRLGQYIGLRAIMRTQDLGIF